MGTPRRLLKPKEAADILRTTTGSLANLRCDGMGPPYLKFQKRIFYDVSELEAWINQHRVKTMEIKK